MAKYVYDYENLTNNVDPNKAVDWMLWVVLEYDVNSDYQEAVEKFVDKHGEALYDLFNTVVYDYVKDFIQSRGFVNALKATLEEEDELAELANYLE